MAKHKRFEVIHKEGNAFSALGTRLVVVDTVTGVNYLVLSGADGSMGITPLLDAEGKVICEGLPEDYEYTDEE